MAVFIRVAEAGSFTAVAEQLGLARSAVTRSIAAKAAEYGLEVDPLRPVHTLSVGEMQRVEIIRALLTHPQLLILDEPTSVLTPQAVEKLFVVLKKLAAQGCSILYISHKLHEIRELCTACTVLRGGKVTGVCNPQAESNASLSRLMIGAEPPALDVRPQAAGETVLTVHDLSLKRDDPFGTDLSHIDLKVCAGEVVGIAGVSGNGQGELLRALSGEDPRGPAGSVTLFGKDIARAFHVARQIDSGICHVNGPTVHDEAQMPFGGVKGSGYGRFGGKAGIQEFTELRWITIQTTPRHYPF